MANTEAQRRASAKYKAKAIRGSKFTLELNVNTDKDIIAYLGKSKNKAGFVKKAIRASMKSKTKAPEAPNKKKQ